MSRKIFLRRSLQTQSKEATNLWSPYTEALHGALYNQIRRFKNIYFNELDLAVAKNQPNNIRRPFAGIDIGVVEQNNKLEINEGQLEDKLRWNKVQILPHRKRKYNEDQWNHSESDLLDSAEVQAQQNNITQNAQQYNLTQPVAKIEQKHHLAQQVRKQIKKKEVNSRRSLGRKCKKVRGNIAVEKGNSLPRRSKRNATSAVESNMAHQCNVCNKTYRKGGYLILHCRRSHPQIISTKTPEVSRKGDKK